MPDLFGADDVTFSVNQYRVSNPQQPQFLVSANIPAAMGVPRPGGHAWHGVPGGSENFLSAKNAEEIM